MEVSCTQCQAKYQFDSAAIPAQGYDAQCTHCGAVFFVAPEQAPESLISVSCRHCGAVYQFPASAIPVGGYDAQCTQCQQVFFVGVAESAGQTGTGPAPGSGGGTPAVEPSAPAAPQPPVELSAPAAPQPPVELSAPAAPQPPVELSAPAAPQPPVELSAPAAPQSPVELVASATPLPSAGVAPGEPVVLGAPKGGEPPPPELAPSTDAAPASRSASAHHGEAGDLMAMAAELGEPLSSPSGANIEEDFEKILSRRRHRRTALLVAVGAVVGYLAITYLLLPRVFDLTVGRLVGVKLTVHPEAIPLAGKAAELLLDDTEAGYAAAVKELDAALALDPAYADAIAWYGLVHILRGEDIRERGRVHHRRAADAIAELQAFEELPVERRPADLRQRVEQLRQQAKASSDESSRLFVEGSKVVREGFTRLRAGVEKNTQVPTLLEAAGIYYAMDSDSVKRAEELLKHALRLRLGDHGKLDLKDPPDPWLPFLQGMILAQDPNKLDDAEAAFSAAAAKEPRLVRAVWERAKLSRRRGDLLKARESAQSILAKVPGHEKAMALLALPTPSAPLSEAPAEPADNSVKAKKRKTKKRR